jgi:hypothetical protein
MRKRVLPFVLVGILLMAGMLVAFTNLPAYAIRWSTIGGGGGAVQSAHYRLGGTVGQAVIGASSSSNYRLGAGYWYGNLEAAVIPTPSHWIYLPTVMKNFTP